MSKAIVEINMPEKCSECPFFRIDCEEEYDYNYEEELEYSGLRCEDACNLSGLVDFNHTNTDESKPKNCPLQDKDSYLGLKIIKAIYVLDKHKNIAEGKYEDEAEEMNENQKLNAVIGYLVELAGTNESINILKRLNFSNKDIADLDLEEELD